MNRRVFGIPLIPLVILVVLVVLFISAWGGIRTWAEDSWNFWVDPVYRSQGAVVQCSESQSCSIVHAIVYGLIFVFAVLTGFAYVTLLERRLISWIQSRVGPNRVGPQGLLQPLADAIKLIFKEDFMPAEAHKEIWFFAPMLKAVPVLIVMAVIPLGPDILVPWFGTWYLVPLRIADPNIGILWILAITSIATYGVVLAGWSSNNKYAMLGGLRASAQMVSYELSLGLTMAVPVMIAGTMSLGAIIDQQKNIWDWFVFQNPLAAGLLMIALLAEVNRAPFDLPEAEQELTAGYMTEYSGMKFAMFMMAEYIGMIAISMIAIALYFGGYHLIPMDGLPMVAPLNFILKIVLLLGGMVWVRGTLPRIRYDRLMTFGWKVMLPLSLLAVAWSAVAVVIGEEAQASTLYGLLSGVLFVGVLAVGYRLLRRAGEDEDDQDDMASDPVITGKPGGVAYSILLLVGGLVSVPFAIVEWNIKMFEGLQRMGQGPADETAIEPAQSKTPTESGGD